MTIVSMPPLNVSGGHDEEHCRMQNEGSLLCAK